MSGTRLKTPPFVFADQALTTYAEGAKAYCRMWGPLGQPAIEAVELWARSQRQFLEALEAGIVAPLGEQRTSHKAGMGPIQGLFSGLGIRFDDG